MILDFQMMEILIGLGVVAVSVLVWYFWPTSSSFKRLSPSLISWTPPEGFLYFLQILLFFDSKELKHPFFIAKRITNLIFGSSR